MDVVSVITTEEILETQLIGFPERDKRELGFL